MHALNRIRPRALTLCMSAALAIAPHVLPADTTTSHIAAKHSPLARAAAASAVNRKGQTLTQIVAELATKARANAPRPPNRPA